MFIRKRFKRVAFVSRLIAFCKTSLLRGTTDIPVRDAPYILEKSLLKIACSEVYIRVHF